MGNIKAIDIAPMTCGKSKKETSIVDRVETIYTTMLAAVEGLDIETEAIETIASKTKRSSMWKFIAFDGKKQC